MFDGTKTPPQGTVYQGPQNAQSQGFPYPGQNAQSQNYQNSQAAPSAPYRDPQSAHNEAPNDPDGGEK